MNYYDLLKQKSGRHPMKPFIIYGGEVITYRDFSRRCEQLAAGIKGLENRVVFAYSDDFLFQLTAFFALQSVRATPLLLHYPLAEERIKALAQEIGVSDLLTVNNLQDLVPDGHTTITKDKLFLSPSSTRRDCVSREQAAFETSLLGLSVQITLDTTRNPPPQNGCMGLLTSGTTGLSKHFYRTYESWADFFPVHNEIFRINSESLMLLHGSLSFTGNLNAALSLLYAGGTLVTAKVFRLKRFEHYIMEFGITHIYLVPAKLHVFADALHQKHPGVLQVLSGSQMLNPATIRKLQKENFPNAEIHLYYGSAELSFLSYVGAEEILSNPLSVGKPFPGVRIFAVGEDLYADTPYHVLGYPRPCPLPDRAYFDEAGQLILRGRRDDLHNIRGFKVSVSHVERVLRAIPGVTDAAVFLETGNSGDAKLSAAVVSGLDEAEIRRELSKKLYKLEIPGKIRLCDSIPHNQAGKPDYKELLGNKVDKIAAVIF